MIKKLHIKNYKSLKSFQLSPGPMTVFAGANASGKSNILDALNFFLVDLHQAGVADAMFRRGRLGFDQLVHRTAAKRSMSGEFVIVGHASEGNPAFEWCYEVEVGPTTDAQVPRVIRETLTRRELTAKSPRNLRRLLHFADGVCEIHDALDEKIVRPQAFAGESALRQFRDPERYSWIPAFWADAALHFFDLDPKDLAQPAVSFLGAVMGFRGENLAAILDRLPESSLSAVARELADVVPVVKSIKAHPWMPGQVIVAITEDGLGDQPFVGEQISAGTLRYIALAALAHGGSGAPQLAVEEVENGIHSGRMHSVIEMLRACAERHSRPRQVFLTTHSGAVLNTLHRDEIVLVSRKDGATVTFPLPDAKEWDKRLKSTELTPADLLLSGQLGPDPDGP